MTQVVTSSASAQALLGGEYPADWDHFIGQHVAKLQLRTAAKSAKIRRASMDHILLASGRPGCGKGHPIDTFVLTPLGWVMVGDLVQGQSITGSDGAATTVTGLFDRGVLPIYRVRFSDGSSTLCDAEHLWSVETNAGRQRNRPMIMSVQDLLEKGVLDARSKARYRIPLVAPVEMSKADLPLDPYLLGVLLANAYLTGTPVIRTNDTEIIQRIRQRTPGILIKEHTYANSTARGWAVQAIRPTLREVGLADHRSFDKFIPLSYLNADIDSRLELLRGLLDCDGAVRGSNGQPEYFTSSPNLAYGVRYMVESLGGTAHVFPVERSHGSEFKVAIAVPLSLFTLSRKANLEKHAHASRTIRSIEPAGEAKVRCIQVAADDQLYVTERFVVTHNTSLALLTAAEKGSNVNVVSGKMRLGEARLALSDMQDGDVLIIDEIHQLMQGGKVNAEWLLNFLQDGVLLGPLGPEEMPKVTIIGCTTEGGRLPLTILERFTIKPDIVAYTQAEAAAIGAGMASQLFTKPLPPPPQSNLITIGEASSRSPRLIRSILITLRDIALTTNASNWKGTEYDLGDTLLWMGLTLDGLDRTCQRYLQALLRDFRGEPAGLTAMMERLQEPGGLAQTERLLVDKGLVTMTKGGRMLTQPGLRRARELERA